MPTRSGFLRRFVPLATAAALVVSASAAGAQQFKYDEKTNQALAKKLNIPVFFAVPRTAYATLPQSIKTTDKLVEFRHPDANGKDVGLRIVRAKRAGLSKRLGKSGLVQTGDLMLTFRAEWGGAGAYPNVQMGISHTGIAYIKDGALYNLDNPMDEVYLGRGFKGDLTSEHYRTLNLLHIIRPRGMTDQQRANLLDWITRLGKNAGKVYPAKIKFNQDYNAPKYKPGRALDFVRFVGQTALGQDPAGTVDMFCSEFAWAVLSLRDCDPKTTADAFKGSKTPSCVKPPMEPMLATGNAAGSSSLRTFAGLTDGPLLVIDALDLPHDKNQALIKSVFAENPTGIARMSVGHQTVAKQYQSDFAKLETVYRGALGGSIVDRGLGKSYSFAFRQFVPQNYSPTSYLVNTLLPPENVNRTMDYVATILIE